ncbi:MAG: ATP-dependent helicase [Candidatus Omnitrophota bacterium]|jgi:DNA helicase-2/ATP-dependent DNA helicase PcrA
MFDFKKELNASQIAAVTTIDGPVLVIAGAGSGKTRAIEYRVLNLIQNNIPPESILLLTFTRKAAREMLSRAEKHDERAKRIDGGTFHSFAFKTLKKYSSALGFSNSFSILDEGDSEDAVQICASRIGAPRKEKLFPKKSTLKNIISSSINKNMPIEEILDREYPHFLEYAPTIDNIRKEYTKYKIGKNYLDYDDLLVYLKLLLEKEDVRRRLSAKYKYVMVDEYQDTNHLQGKITYLLAKDHNNIMVVGDDAQSIYGFRGSSHANIMDFPKMFPGCRIIKLEANYRSAQPVLDVANAILENMENSYSKCLTSVRKKAGEKPKLLFFKDAYQEAEWVAEKIKELREDGEGLGETAVLFRSAYISIPLQAELSKLSIPYQVFGGLKFYETSHVKDVLSHLKVILNPKDELSWMRIFMLIEGIGQKGAEKLVNEIMQHTSIENMAEALIKKCEKPSHSSRGLKRLASSLRGSATFKLSPGAQYSLMLDYYAPLLKDKFDDWHIRINDLEALRQITEKYDSLETLLADFAIEPPDRGVWGVEGRIHPSDRPLTLSTIHSAKGLEWKNVFLIGLIDGLLPISFALNNDREIEEECRLFYVAVTRAKDNLFLSLHHEGMRGGISQFNKVSRFVDAPGVLSRLDQSAVFEPELGSYYEGRSNDEVISLYDKDSFFNDIIDSFK